MGPRFFEHPREMKIGAKNRRVREIGDEGDIVLESGEEKDVWFKLSRGLK